MRRLSVAQLQRRRFFSDLFVGSFLIFALAASVWMVAK